MVKVRLPKLRSRSSGGPPAAPKAISRKSGQSSQGRQNGSPSTSMVCSKKARPGPASSKGRPGPASSKGSTSKVKREVNQSPAPTKRVTQSPHPRRRTMSASSTSGVPGTSKKSASNTSNNSRSSDSKSQDSDGSSSSTSGAHGTSKKSASNTSNNSQSSESDPKSQDSDGLSSNTSLKSASPVAKSRLPNRRRREGSGSSDWEVEEILGKRTSKGKSEYKVKWVGWDETECTWEPLSNLTNCQKLLDEFHNRMREECEQRREEKEKKEWEVEKIVDKRIHLRTIQYRVKWAGWDEKYNTWEPIENLTNSTDMVKEFNEKWMKERAERKCGPGRGYTKAILGAPKKRAVYESDGDGEEEEED